MWVLMFGEGLSRAEAYDACFDYWEAELFDWQGYCDHIVGGRVGPEGRDKL